MINIYTIFHGNLQFSSIPKNQYKTVIKNCYWPLVKILEENKNLKFGIELNGLTLLEIKRLDTRLIKIIKSLISQKRIEFIGSSYTQAIFPLIPYEVNLKNLELGIKVYKEILGFVPKIFYVNEQTFSDGIIDVNQESGIENIIIDFDTRAEDVCLDKSLMYSPAIIKNQNGKEINVIWNSSIAFQKLQRYIFDEISYEDYRNYLSSQITESREGSLCLYGGDWEVFGFSPKGIKRNYKNDFKRMEVLFEKLIKEDHLQFVLPSSLINKITNKTQTSITDFADPILCKKQEKYNVSRWALAGKNSVLRNTQCFRLFKEIQNLREKGADKKIIDKLEKNLVILWGSDYRTNTTADKNKEYETLYKKTENNIAEFVKGNKNLLSKRHNKGNFRPLAENGIIETDQVKLTLDWRKGATIKKLFFPKIFPKKMAGQVPHGHFQNPKLSPDWFSGYCVFEAEGDKKYTDLSPTEIFIDEKSDKSSTQAVAQIKTEICSIEKIYHVYKNEPRVDLRYIYNFKKIGLKSARVGSVTFDPQNLDKKSFWYATVNGGNAKETYYMGDKHIIQDGPVSFRISSRGCLGATEGWLAAGDKEKGILLNWDSREIASFPIVHFENTPQGLYGQIHHSIAESDETGFPVFKENITFKTSIIGFNKLNRIM